MNSELKLIFELGNELFYTKQSNKNTLYYVAKKSSGDKILNLRRIKAGEFWEKFNKCKIDQEETQTAEVETPEETEEVENIEEEPEQEFPVQEEDY